MKINEPLMNLFLIPIKKMECNHRVKFACHNENIGYLVQALSPTAQYWRRTPSIGEKSFDDIKEIIAKMGFTIGALEQFKKELCAAKTYEELRTLIENDASLQVAIIAYFHGELQPQHHWMYGLFPEELQQQLGGNFDKIAGSVLNNQKIQEQVS